MKWNTKSFTNIDDDTFIGRYDGVDFQVKPGETRYFPSAVSDHLSQQLTKKIIDSEKPYETEALNRIVGEEIKTAETETEKSFKEEVKDHEQGFKQFEERKKKEELLRRNEALSIAKVKTSGARLDAKKDV